MVGTAIVMGIHSAMNIRITKTNWGWGKWVELLLNAEVLSQKLWSRGVTFPEYQSGRTIFPEKFGHPLKITV